MNTAEFFHKNPLFRREDFVVWKNQNGTHNPHSIASALQHYVKTGRLLRIHRVFVVIPPGESKNPNIDPYLLAAKSAPDSILGYHTALELHGFAYSTFSQFTFITAHKVKSFEYEGLWFKPISIPISLKKHEKQMMGVTIINRQGVDIKITTIERTFVDVIDRAELCGGWEEVSRSIATIPILDVDEIIKYCLFINNATLIAKVGYFLEQRQGVFSIPEKKLHPLLKKIPLSPQYITDRHRGKCQLILKWNLLVPVALLHNTWEEPNYDV